MTEKLIFITNDDGINAKGIKSLIEIAKPFGKIIVVAPEVGNSGMSHALTIKTPLRLRKVSEEDGIVQYAVNGTPVDCVKLAFSQVLPAKPDLLISGINHGSNSSISVIYSGTMAAAIEGSLYNVPSVGFSSTSYDKNQSFEMPKAFGGKIVKKVLEEGLKKGTCLNVNFPDIKAEECKGIKIARQNKGRWVEEFDKRTDPRGSDYFWLTGYFENDEKESTDTDEWALNNNYISIVPVSIDFTAYSEIENLKTWNF